MGTATGTETIQAARKPHACDWCGETIERGQPYKRWRWFESREATTVRAHPECTDAINELAREEGHPIEFMLGDNPRGCCCGHDRGCPRCAERESQRNAEVTGRGPGANE